MNEYDLINYAKFLANHGGLRASRLGVKAGWDEDLLGRAVFAAAQEYHAYLPSPTQGVHTYTRLRFNRIKAIHTALLKARDQAGDIAHSAGVHHPAQSA